jgi:NTP pyrophosphatase (non-canonical NTP hydrolase)
MQFREYQEKAAQTAIYPTQYRLIYPTIGLSNELGEVVEEVEGEGDPIKVVNEISDCLWYVALILKDADIDLDYNLNQTTSVQYEGVGEAVILVGKICGLIKKSLRDGYELKEKATALTTLAARLLDQFRAMVDLAGFTLAEVAQRNLDKLASRQERGVLGGSGDER